MGWSHKRRLEYNLFISSYILNSFFISEFHAESRFWSYSTLYQIYIAPTSVSKIQLFVISYRNRKRQNSNRNRSGKRESFCFSVLKKKQIPDPNNSFVYVFYKDLLSFYIGGYYLTFYVLSLLSRSSPDSKTI